MQRFIVDALADYATRVLDDPATPHDFGTAVRQLIRSADTPLDEFITGTASMLYIDASILKVLARASMGLHEDGVRECISTLDHAIIIAGAARDTARRDHLVHDLIKRFQSTIPWQPPTTAVLTAVQAPPLSLPTGRHSIRVLTQLPSLLTPIHHWSRAPFVLRGCANDWPATLRWSSPSYLFSVAGPGRVVPVEIGDDYRSDDWTQKLISWEDFLACLVSPQDHPVYLAQHCLFAQFPQLRDDILIPDIVYASLDPSDFPSYRPPHDTILNAWLGPKGTLSPAHTDPFFNCYVQIVGTKSVWLAPPAAATAMYPYQSSIDGTDRNHNPAVNPLLSNTSQVDVFPQDIEASKSTFPLFWDTVPDQASCLTLNPGDLLFFPPGWWHAMRSEDVSFSVSMWF